MYSHCIAQLANLLDETTMDDTALNPSLAATSSGPTQATPADAAEGGRDSSYGRGTLLVGYLGRAGGGRSWCVEVITNADTVTSSSTTTRWPPPLPLWLKHDGYRLNRPKNTDSRSNPIDTTINSIG